MYYYYYATAGGRRIWWKKYLTTMQITQFVVDLLTVYYAYYSYIAATYFPFLPHQGNCYGKESAAVVGSTLLTSYLFLFIDFYIRTYKPAATAAQKSSANGNGKVL